MFLDLFERHYVNGKEKKVLSEQKRQIRAENIFPPVIIFAESALQRFQKKQELVLSNQRRNFQCLK